MPDSWMDKWARVLSKYDTCLAECVTGYRSTDKCRDSLEAVIADIWNLKDWLINDPTCPLTSGDVHAFLRSPDGFHITACADLETRTKHYRVDDPRRNDTRLVLEENHLHTSGMPVIFSAKRKYKTADVDHWEDAVELARRAVAQWRAFLAARGLQTNA